MNRITVLLLCSVLVLASCTETAKEPGEKKQNTDVMEKAPQENWLQLDYDDVRVRESAGMDSKVIATLKVGTKVKDLDEQSDFKTKVKLRGEEKNEPWRKIETVQGTVGWIYGGTVSPSKPPAEGETFTADFGAELKKIDTKKCTCLNQAIQSFKTTFKGQPAKVIDNEISTLMEFLETNTNQFSAELESRPYYEEFYLINYNPDGKPIAKGMREDLERYEGCGMQMFFSEGSAYLMLEPGLVLDKLNTMLSSDMRKYLGQMKKEDENIWAEDAGLTIPIQKVAERAIFWEKFANDVPDFVFIKNAKANLKTYTGTLMGGLDNTPAFEFSGKRKLDPAYKKTYEWIMKDHPELQTGKIIKEYYMMLKETGFASNDKARKYLERFWQ